MRKVLALLVTLAVMVSVLSTANAEERRGKDGFLNTGSAVRTRAVSIVHVKLYAIRHDIKCSLQKDARLVIQSLCSKRFVLRFLRDIAADKLREHLAAGFRLNGFGEREKADLVVSAFKSDVREGQTVVLRFDQATSATTIEFSDGVPMVFSGVGAMRAIWSLWFGVSDQEGLADALLTNL
jgi:hypothetical protein